MSEFRADWQRWGATKAIYARILIRLERYLGVHIFLINSRPLNPETDAAVLPDGHSVRYLEPSDIDVIDANPELQLSAASIQAALERGDICIGYFDESALVSYFWCGFSTVPMERGLWVQVPPREYSYAYKALTLESHRGHRLQNVLTQANDALLTRRGFKFNIEYIAPHNFAQRAASARYGNRTMGIAGYISLFGRVVSFRSPAIKKLKFRFFAAHPQP